MSINLNFEIRDFFQKDNLNEAKAKHMLEKLCNTYGYYSNWKANAGHIELCPEGEVYFRIEDNVLYGDTQTNVAGPGFHAAVIDFLDDFITEGNYVLDIEDETGYCGHRDFTRMCEEYYHKWLYQICSALKEQWQKKHSSLRTCWPLDHYVPKDRKGHVVTPMGYLSYECIQDVVDNKNMIEFAQNFFIWPHREKDAYYYRNCALHNLWMHCMFQPKERSKWDDQCNRSIIFSMQMAIKKDPNIPYPMEAYQEICALQHLPLPNIEGFVSMQEDIGYLRDDVMYTIGNLVYAIPGHYLSEFEEDAQTQYYYDKNPNIWHNVRVRAYRTNEEYVPYVKLENTHSFEQWEDEKCRIKVFHHPNEEGAVETFAVTSAQVITPYQVTSFTFCYNLNADPKWMIRLLKQAHYQKPYRS